MLHEKSDTEIHIEKVAVIAVHGVGQQNPNETARQISDMLSRVGLQSGSTVHVESVTENSLTIPVKHEWPISKNEIYTPDVKFSLDAIQKLDASDELLKYQTTSFHSGVSANGKSSKFDVFELFWNDLSHAPSSFEKFLAELYQVFFHLASIGRKTVRFATDAPSTSGRIGIWLRSIRWCHDMMQALLPTTIPILNLFLLASALPILVLLIPESLRSQIAIALAFLETSLPLSLLLSRTRLGVRGIALSIGAGLATSGAIYLWGGKSPTALLMITLLVFGYSMAVMGSRALLDRYQPSYK